jgi:hypothetical protein
MAGVPACASVRRDPAGFASKNWRLHRLADVINRGRIAAKQRLRRASGGRGRPSWAHLKNGDRCSGRCRGLCGVRAIGGRAGTRSGTGKSVMAIAPRHRGKRPVQDPGPAPASVQAGAPTKILKTRCTETNPAENDAQNDDKADQDVLAQSFVRLINLPSYPLDRLRRYEGTIGRQPCQILFTLFISSAANRGRGV